MPKDTHLSVPAKRFNDVIHVSITCKICKDEHMIDVEIKDLEKYQRGALVQDAFPYLSAGERELFITQFCGKCYDNLFRNPDDEMPRKEVKEYREE